MVSFRKLDSKAKQEQNGFISTSELLNLSICLFLFLYEYKIIISYFVNPFPNMMIKLACQEGLRNILCTERWVNYTTLDKIKMIWSISMRGNNFYLTSITYN